MNSSRPVRSQYENFMRHVFTHGVSKTDRTATGTRSVFGHQMRFNLDEGFPLVTTKKVHFKASRWSCCGFCGESNANWLRERGVTIWDEWASPEGDLGPVYGVQWRSWPAPDGGHIDQIAQVVKQLKSDPDSRRIIVSAWNVADLPKMALAPCHAFFQFYVAPGVSGQRGRLSCQLYQRSADVLLGVPFNIASYALLTHMLAQQCDLDVGDFVWTGGDAAFTATMSNRCKRNWRGSRSPSRSCSSSDGRRRSSTTRTRTSRSSNYDPHPAIKAPVAV
jgi:thymidylate synthase